MQTPKKPGLALLPLVLSLNAFDARSETPDTAMFSVSGFGTTGVVRTNNDLAQYARVNQVSGADRSPDATVDTAIGVQLTGKFSDSMSAMAQVLSQKGPDNNFNPKLNWAFIKAKLSDSVSIRGGRLGLPAYAVSDYRQVGYANTWLRPPMEVYNLPYDYIDGADVLYKTAVGDDTLSGQVLVGRVSARIAPNGSVLDTTARNTVALNASWEHGPVTLRARHVRTNLTATSSDLERLTDGVASLAAALGDQRLNALANDLRADGKPASFSEIGITADWGNFLLLAEATRTLSDARSIPEQSAWYATLGYRTGKWTPYVTYSTVRTTSAQSDSTIPRRSPQLVALSDGLNQLLAGHE